MLRNLLRTEVGEVSNHRAWADDAHLTPELLQLYKGPLQVVNWDRALVEVRAGPVGWRTRSRAGGRREA